MDNIEEEDCEKYIYKYQTCIMKAQNNQKKVQ